jgi:signal transduction histidine kinase
LEAVAGRLQQQQRELLRTEQLSAVGQLAAGVAHEIRNPLTGIKLLVEAAARQKNPRPLDAEDLRVIHGEVAKLEQTVQNFLTFARLPAPLRAPCDLREVISQASELVRGRAGQQHVEVVVESPEVPVVVPVDRGQIGTVLVNLLLNALDATSKGGRIEVVLEPPANGAVRVVVSDTGSGIPEAVLGRLFTPFVTTKSTGTGLGLSLAARVVEEHGGAVSGGNRPEGGARFVLSLPAPRTEVCRDDAAGR